MKLKTNLHFHSSDDPEDPISHSSFEAIDKAAELGFDAIAITCHNLCAVKEEYTAYAESKGILLISGIEKTIEKSHVVILNSDKAAEQITTFGELALYKKSNPDIFVIAPHPFFPHPCSLKNKLIKHLSIFDAIELSWFYSKRIDCNKKARILSKEKNIPLVAASDTHCLSYLDTCYAVVDAKEKTAAGVFEAIREHKIENTSQKSSLLFTLIPFMVKITFECFINNIKKRLTRNRSGANESRGKSIC